MSVRQKIKKNSRMNQFARKYYCYIGGHIVPVNRMHTIRIIDEEIGFNVTGNEYRVCDLHMKDLGDRFEKVG